MARKKHNELLVGGFIAVALGLFLLLFFLKGTLSEVFRPTGEVRVVFEDIRGLKVGDPVFFLGSKVGWVTGTQFSRKPWGKDLPALFPGEEGDSSRVVIAMRMDRELLRHLRHDSEVEIDKNLTGNISVLIREGKGRPLPEEGALLRGSPGVDLNSIAESVNAVLRKFEPAAADLAGVAAELREGLGPIRSDLQGAISEARAILGENRGDLRAAVARLAEGAELARKVLEKVEPAAGELEGAVARVERAAAAAEGLLEENRTGLAAIVEDARRAVASAANITADIRRRPWRLLHRPSQGELESLDLYDAAWAYHLGASELERSLEGLAERMERNPAGDAPPPALRTAYLQVEESLKRHREAEEEFWRRLKGR